MRLNIDPFKDYEEILGVSQAHEIKTARVLLRATSDKLNSVREELENNPRRNPESLKDDPVYQLGFIAGLKYVLNLKTRAAVLIEKLGEQVE